MKIALLLAAFLSLPHLVRADPFRVEVVEKETGWPVPLVELRTTHQVRFFTDNAGIAAIDLPEVMGRDTWLGVNSDGYEFPKDALGMRGVRLTPQAGKSHRIEMTRTAIAKRLGRITGAGLFGESQRIGRELEWGESGVFGCDSVQNAIYHGKLFWSWGDTVLSGYPLGIFDMSGATTSAQPLLSLQPPVRLKFDYFTNTQGQARAIAKMPGEGPTWASGFATLPDRTGTVRLVASYIKVKPVMEAYESGLCVWSDRTAIFEPHQILWTKTESKPQAPPIPKGHAVYWRDATNQDWVLFGDPFPALRCRASFEDWENPARWEIIPAPESLDAAGMVNKVKPHSGSIAWNSFRKRWITVFMETFGQPSAFGEVWYAESDSPLGPWGQAVKVLSHENYTFYNPVLHPEFSPTDSPILLFEGTYSMQFSKNATATPRFDYNQVLYRLDLNDPLLKPAQGQ